MIRGVTPPRDVRAECPLPTSKPVSPTLIPCTPFAVSAKARVSYVVNRYITKITPAIPLYRPPDCCGVSQRTSTRVPSWKCTVSPLSRFLLLLSPVARTFFFFLRAPCATATAPANGDLHCATVNPCVSGTARHRSSDALTDPIVSRYRSAFYICPRI